MRSQCILHPQVQMDKFSFRVFSKRHFFSFHMYKPRMTYGPSSKEASSEALPGLRNGHRSPLSYP